MRRIGPGILALAALSLSLVPAKAFAQLPFSYLVTPPPGAVIATPLAAIRANAPAPGLPRSPHNWWVMANGWSMTVTLANASPDGAKITVFDATGGLVTSIAPIFGSFASPARASATFAAVPGAQYRVQVDASGIPGPGQCACPDYFLETAGALEVGMATQTAFNMLAVPGPPAGDHSGSSVNWKLNVAPGEALDLRFNPTGDGSTAPNLRVVLIDANDQVRLDERVTPPASNALPREIHIPDAGNAPGAWTMALWGEPGPFPRGPYRIARQTGADRAVYVAWDTTGTGAIDVNVVQGAAPSTTPFLSPVDVLVTSIGGFQELRTVTTHTDDTDDSLGLRKLHVLPPPGWTATPVDLDMIVTYGETASVTIRVQDLTPPTLTLPANILALATSAAGAAVVYDATATDLDVVTVPADVTCSNPSGSAFPLGLTTVNCTATDARGNTTSGSFTVLVYAAAAASGGFVIGDLGATVGAQVTFWDGQWSKANALSGGAAPVSFKGFANASTTNPTTVGGSWTTDPGNSPPPPATVASYIAVMVSSAATKSGSTISGNVVAWAIVRTDPGYAGNAGHAGTGTIVEIIR